MPAATPLAPAPGSSRSTHRTSAPRLGGAPCARQADDPPADHDEVVGASLRCCCFGVHCLRRHYPDQVPRSAARCRPLSPVAPVVTGYPGRSDRIRRVSDLRRAPPLLRDRRRHAARAAARRARRRRRHGAAARSGRLRRRAARRRRALPRGLRRARRALLGERPPRPRARRRRRRRARGPGRHAGRPRPGAASCSSGCPPTRRSSSRPACRSGADQLSVGPVWETPTKPGRPAAGLDYVRHAAARRPASLVRDRRHRHSNVAEVVEAGASRIVVVRAIRDAADPRAAAAALRAALDRRPVGAAQ